MPDLKNKPIAIVRECQSQLSISAVNNVAELAGLKPQMALADARAILPSITLHSSNLVEDQKMLNRIAQWCERYSPWTRGEDTDSKDPSLEGAGGAGLWLDITGCAHLYGGEEDMLIDMIKRIEKLGFKAHAAIADTLGCAWAIARFSMKQSPWRIVPPGKSRQAIAPLTIAALRLPPTTVLSLHEIGLRYIKDLMNIPRGPLTVRYDEDILFRLDTALGERGEPFSPILPSKPLISRLAFAEPIGHRDGIIRSITKLLDNLCDTLGKTGQGAREITLSAYRPNGGTTPITIKTAYPNREPKHLLKLFIDRLDQIDPEFGIDEITLFVSKAEPLQAIQTNFQHNSATQNMKSYQAVIDRLANRFGYHNLQQVYFKESHVPERAARLISIGNPGKKKSDKQKILSPRPLRLLHVPQRIEMISKNTKGLPITFRWRKVLHHIKHSEGPERIAAEWWTDSDTDTRDYYRTENDTGQRFWLFTNSKGTWFIHGIFG